MVFREHKWTQHTVSPQKKSQTDDLFKSLWSWRGTKTGRETLCLFLDWIITTINERNIPYLRKMTKLLFNNEATQKKEERRTSGFWNESLLSSKTMSINMAHIQWESPLHTNMIFYCLSIICLRVPCLCWRRKESLVIVPGSDVVRSWTVQGGRDV